MDDSSAVTPGHPDDPEEWRHETAYVNGVELHYVTVDPTPAAVDHPTGDAPLVVLLHGFPEFWYAWRHQLTPLAEAGYRVVAPDLRGYNRSSQPSGVDSYRMDELVADVRGLVEAQGAPQATVVGHDWGGAIAWEVAIRNPELVRKLAILNAPHPEAYRQSVWTAPEQLLKSWYVLAFQLPWVPERLLAAGEFALLEEALTDTVRPDAFSDAEIARYKAAMARTESLSGPVNYYRAIAQETLGRELQTLLPGADPTWETMVDVPTLVVWGEQDTALSVRLLDGLDRWVPDMRVVRLPTASHWVQAEAPDRVTEELLAFFEE